MPEPGAWNSSQVFQLHFSHLPSLLQLHYQGAGLEAEQGQTIQCQKQKLKPLYHNASPILFLKFYLKGRETQIFYVLIT